METSAQLQPSVLVAVCTRHRNDLLTRCLNSLAALSPAPGWNVALAVVDNSAGQTARPVAKAFASRPGLNLHYLHAPRQGIPLARNAALRFGIENRYDHLAFIDDDETATPGWLIALLHHAKPGVIVHGQVLQQLPPGTPPWVQSVIGLQKKNKEDGALLSYCATDNILIPLHTVSEYNLVFDERRPLAGGTDVLFTAAARKLGMKIIQCNNATVTETLTPDRVQMPWLRRRKFRAGIDIGRQKSRKVKSVCSAVLQILFRSVVYLLATLTFQTAAKHKSQLRIWRSAGVISGALGGSVDAYADR